jgi:hypothetical protein
MTQPAARSSERRRCTLVTVLWGEWHRDTFLSVNLPTMLASGNVPALIAGVDCEYRVYTTQKDAAAMMKSGAFQRLRALMPVALKLFTPSKTRNPISLHHDIWRAATAYARQRGSFILLMPPDVAWADGSFARLRAALAAGKRAIFMAYPRVVSETIMPAMAEGFRRGADEAMTIPARAMMALAITHIHPLMAAYGRTSTHFPIHPEMILWPIENDGFLLRLLARELFCFEPGRYPLNQQSLLARSPPAAESHVFHDSNEFLGVSLTPLWKDMEWYLRRARLDPLFVGRWWSSYDSPANDYLSAIDLRFTCGGADEAQWRRAACQADGLLTHLRSAREFVRVLLTLERMGHLRAAAFLAAALRVHGLARRWAHRGPFVVLSPADDAFEAAGFRRVPGDGMSAIEAREMIEAHVAVVRSSKLIESGTELTTLAGQTFRLTDTKLAQQCGDNLLVPVRTILCRQQATSAPPQAATAIPAASAVG